MSKYNPFNSTIFNKVVMAVTGFLLVLFILVHALGNLQIFLGKEVFNAYAAFLKSTGELLWIARAGLLIFVVLHIYTSIKLKFHNLSAKPEGYKVKSHVKSTLYSRNMIYTGITICLFVIYHILHFTAYVTNPEYSHLKEMYGPKLQTTAMIETKDGTIEELSAGKGIFERHDAFEMVILGFNNPLIAIVYIFAVLFLGLHLAHAIQSMFQTLGWNGPTLSPMLIFLSRTVGWGLFIVFASVPVGIWIFGYGKGVVGL
jgi:succinate dehydrogenase / fumarate reductase cytochrome b subunit